ncbi:MAG: hypothetical protein AAF382_05605 [Pseudomonadota bacterium]
MIFRVVTFCVLALALAWQANTSYAGNAQKMVNVFHGAMSAVPDLQDLERYAKSKGFSVVSRQQTDGFISFLETVDASGNLFLVGRRDHWTSLDADSVMVIVTLYKTNQDFFGDLVETARETLPKGAPQNIDLTHGFVAGEAWAANYPDLVSMRIMYHKPERGSLIEAHLVSMR